MRKKAEQASDKFFKRGRIIRAENGSASAEQQERQALSSSKRCEREIAAGRPTQLVVRGASEIASGRLW